MTEATLAAAPACHMSNRGGAPRVPESGTRNGGGSSGGDAGHSHYNVARMPRQGADARLDGHGKPVPAEHVPDRLGLCILAVPLLAPAPRPERASDPHAGRAGGSAR